MIIVSFSALADPKPLLAAPTPEDLDYSLGGAVSQRLPSFAGSEESLQFELEYYTDYRLLGDAPSRTQRIGILDLVGELSSRAPEGGAEGGSRITLNKYVKSQTYDYGKNWNEYDKLGKSSVSYIAPEGTGFVIYSMDPSSTGERLDQARRELREALFFPLEIAMADLPENLPRQGIHVISQTVVDQAAVHASLWREGWYRSLLAVDRDAKKRMDEWPSALGAAIQKYKARLDVTFTLLGETESEQIYGLTFERTGETPASAFRVPWGSELSSKGMLTIDRHTRLPRKLDYEVKDRQWFPYRLGNEWEQEMIIIVSVTFDSSIIPERLALH